jgi:hypothetical protein
VSNRSQWRLETPCHEAQLLADIHRFDANAGWAGTRSQELRPLAQLAHRRGSGRGARASAGGAGARGNAQLLLDMTTGATGAQLERPRGKLRTLERPGQLDRFGRLDAERRFVARRHMPDGTVRIELRLHPDEAERIWEALQAIRQELVAGCSDDIDAAAAPPSSNEGPAPDDEALGFTAASAPAGHRRRRQTLPRERPSPPPPSAHA